MNDPRFNSIHLDPARRAVYRDAREALLNAQGDLTMAGQKPLPGEDRSQTIIQALNDPRSLDLDFWLMDKDYIYPLKLGVNTVGRSSDNDVVVADSFISRRHCAILIHHTTSCELHDMASKNGTFVNGVKMAGPCQLKSGDEIRMYNHLFIYLCRTQGSAVKPPSTATMAG